MKNRAPKLSPKLEDELRDKLENLLDEHDDVATKKKRVAKALKGHLSILDDSISLVRRQLKGQDLDQLEIAGTEVPEPTRDPAVLEILKLAGGIVTRKDAPGEDDDEQGDEVEDEAGDEPTDGKKRPAPLPWREVAPGRISADLPDGVYLLEQVPSGGWTSTWRPHAGRQKVLAVAKPKLEARGAAVVHHAERFADELLREGGSGDLVRGDLKGAPEAFKKGARRG